MTDIDPAELLALVRGVVQEELDRRLPAARRPDLVRVAALVRHAAATDAAVVVLVPHLRVEQSIAGVLALVEAHPDLDVALRACVPHLCVPWTTRSLGSLLGRLAVAHEAITYRMLHGRALWRAR